jgi:CheY-like chemotaxis protein
MEQPSPISPTSQTALENVTDNLLEMDLSGGDSSTVAPMVQANETFAASQTSQHAQKAIHEFSQRPELKLDGSGDEGFPFPADRQRTGKSSSPESRGEATHPISSKQHRSSNGTFDNHDSVTQQRSDHTQPRVLVVDDNLINQRLLATYLKTKRQYKLIETAENGQKAVDMAIAADPSFNIIFMDISMPVMDGFEATRAIREYEGSEAGRPRAMIIALTGLASGRDQREGFESGCDLYMTKPVSFKQVGKLLDNWEMHQSKEDTKSDDTAAV